MTLNITRSKHTCQLDLNNENYKILMDYSHVYTISGTCTYMYYMLTLKFYCGWVTCAGVGEMGRVTLV